MRIDNTAEESEGGGEIMDKEEESKILTEVMKNYALLEPHVLTDGLKKLLKERYPVYYLAIIEEIEALSYNLGAVIIHMMIDIHGRNMSTDLEKKFIWSFMDTAKEHLKNALLRIDNEPHKFSGKVDDDP